MKRVLHIAWTGLLLIALLPILPLVALMWGFSWYEASHSKTSVTALRVATWVMPWQAVLCASCLRCGEFA